MTHDYSVLSSENRVEKMALSIEMLNRGWRIFFLQATVWQKVVASPILPSLGNLDPQVIICGWETGDPKANQFEELLADLNFEALCPHIESSPSFAGARVETSAVPPMEVPPPSFLNRDLHGRDEIHDALKKARWGFYIFPETGQSPAANDFRRECWYSIAKLTDGLADDEHSMNMFVGTPRESLLSGVPGLVQKLVGRFFH